MGKLTIKEFTQVGRVLLSSLRVGELFVDPDDGNDICMVIENSMGSRDTIQIVSLKNDVGTYWVNIPGSRKVIPVDGNLSLE